MRKIIEEVVLMQQMPRFLCNLNNSIKFRKKLCW